MEGIKNFVESHPLESSGLVGLVAFIFWLGFSALSARASQASARAENDELRKKHGAPPANW